MPRLITIVFALMLAVTCQAFDCGFNFDFGGSPGKVQWVDLLPSLSWSPSSKAFGNHSTGTVTRQWFTLSNSSNDTAEDVAVSLTGAGFSIYSTTTFGNISASRSRTAKIRFSPVAAQEYTGFLNYSAPNIAKVAANLTGTGTADVSTFGGVIYINGSGDVLADQSNNVWGSQ
jgi:hypothetical protein